jgi:HPt (histidine-containing phosphotransfer) domain-containing protein
MNDALEQQDFTTLKFLAHNMSGSGGAYGFQGLTDTGAALERAAKNADIKASRRWVDDLSNYLLSVDKQSGTDSIGNPV